MTPTPHPCTFVLVLLVLGAAASIASGLEKSRLETGVFHAREGRYDDAHRQFALVLATDPDDARALNNAGNVYLLEGATDRALELYARARTAAPDVPGILLNIGIAHHLRGDRTESLRWLREGMLRMEDPREAYYLLGLSEAPTDQRASETERSKDMEIEALLDQALASVPATPAAPSGDDVASASRERATSGPTDGSEPTASDRRVATRAGGARAAEAGRAETTRLFWMLETVD